MYSELFVKYNILPVRAIFKYNVYIASFGKNDELKVRVHPHNTRLTNRPSYFVPIPNNNYGNKTLPYILPTLWNCIPDYIFNEKTKIGFKIKIKKWLIEQCKTSV